MSRSGRRVATPRFIVTNLPGGRARTLYERVYCRRGMAENHIKSWKTHLAADRTSMQQGDGKPVPAVPACGGLLAHVGAACGDAETCGLCGPGAVPDTFACARSIKIAARVVEMKTRICLHLPTSCPDHAILRNRAEGPDTTSRHVATGDVGAPFEPRDRKPANPAPYTISATEKRRGGSPCAGFSKNPPPGDTRP